MTATPETNPYMSATIRGLGPGDVSVYGGSQCHRLVLAGAGVQFDVDTPQAVDRSLAAIDTIQQTLGLIRHHIVQGRADAPAGPVDLASTPEPTAAAGVPFTLADVAHARPGDPLFVPVEHGGILTCDPARVDHVNSGEGAGFTMQWTSVFGDTGFWSPDEPMFRPARGGEVAEELPLTPVWGAAVSARVLVPDVPPERGLALLVEVLAGALPAATVSHVTEGGRVSARRVDGRDGIDGAVVAANILEAQVDDDPRIQVTEPRSDWHPDPAAFSTK